MSKWFTFSEWWRMAIMSIGKNRIICLVFELMISVSVTCTNSTPDDLAKIRHGRSWYQKITDLDRAKGNLSATSGWTNVRFHDPTIYLGLETLSIAQQTKLVFCKCSLSILYAGDVHKKRHKSNQPGYGSRENNDDDRKKKPSCTICQLVQEWRGTPPIGYVRVWPDRNFLICSVTLACDITIKQNQTKNS